MPIYGLTDETRYQPGRSFPIAFTLHKGIGEEMPNGRGKKLSDLNYFRASFAPGYERLEPLFVDLYGEQPQIIPNIMLLGGTVDQVASAHMEQWATNKNGQPRLMVRCNGQEIIKRLDLETGHYSYQPAPCMVNDPERPCKCGVKFRLSFLPLDLLREAQLQEPVVGSIALRSPREVRDIMNYLRDRAAWRTLAGFENAPLAGVRWDLVRAPVELEIPPDPNGKETPGVRTFWLVKIQVRSMGEGQMLAAGVDHVPQIAAPQPEAQGEAPDTSTGEVSYVIVDAIVINYDKDKDGERRSKTGGAPKYVYTLFTQDATLPNIAIYSEAFLAPWLDLDAFRQQIGKRQPFNPMRVRFAEKSRKGNVATGEISDVAPADMPL